MRKWQKWISCLCCLGLLLTPFGGISASAETEQEEWFRSTPTSAVFDKLWVGDVIYFNSQSYWEDEQAAPGNTMTILSGDGVKIVDTCLGPGEYCKGLQFTKPGKAQVKIKETKKDTGASKEKTFSFTVTQRPADKPVTVTYKNAFGNVKLKIGERLADTAWKNIWVNDPYVSMETHFEEWFSIKFQNANYGRHARYEICPGGIENLNDYDLFWPFGLGGRGGGSDSLIEDNRVVGSQSEAYYYLERLGESYAFEPGIKPLDIVYNGIGKMGSLGTITVEEPVITTNAPASVKAGSTLTLTTALTNTALKNLKTAEYEDQKNYDYGSYKFQERGTNPVAYKPSVTVIEGKDCVTQSKQDYSNTLSSSEALTFKKAGTVKLKVTYTQFATDPYLLYEPGHIEEIPNDKRYHPEKIITIQVTDKSSSSPTASVSENNSSDISNTSLPTTEERAVVLADEGTGIQLGAEEGIIPPDTALVVVPSNFVLEDAAGKFVAFDISLENNGTKIQPNGKVQISIPIPEGYDRERLTVYHIADDRMKIELPCTVIGDDLTFETDHFSLYVLAETAANETAADASQTDKALTPQEDKESSPVPWIILGVVIVLIAGAAAAVLFLKKRNNG